MKTSWPLPCARCARSSSGERGTRRTASMPLSPMALLLTTVTAMPQTPKPAIPESDVVVTAGEAVIKQAPDQAFVTLGVGGAREGPSPKAQKVTAAAMSSVQQKLRRRDSGRRDSHRSSTTPAGVRLRARQADAARRTCRGTTSRCASMRSSVSARFSLRRVRPAPRRSGACGSTSRSVMRSAARRSRWP